MDIAQRERLVAQINAAQAMLNHKQEQNEANEEVVMCWS
jgi:hypothetical protein